VTVTDAEVWLFPARSVATADSTCWPPVLFRVFHGICHGALVTVAEPRAVKKATEAMPLFGSAGEATTLMFPSR
jgi:hypothetical protein